MTAANFKTELYTVNDSHLERKLRKLICSSTLTCLDRHDEKQLHRYNVAVCMYYIQLRWPKNNSLYLLKLRSLDHVNFLDFSAS